MCLFLPFPLLTWTLSSWNISLSYQGQIWSVWKNLGNSAPCFFGRHLGQRPWISFSSGRPWCCRWKTWKVIQPHHCWKLSWQAEKRHQPFIKSIFTGRIVRNIRSNQTHYMQCFFRFWGPNSDRFFGLTEANFEANSADFSQLTQNFGNFKQKPSNFGLTGTKYCPNSAIFQYNSAKIFLWLRISFLIAEKALKKR